MTLRVASIDDSPTITKHLNYLFKKHDEIEWVGHAFDLAEGKKIIKSQLPDVILLDIMVNEESGFELLHFIKQNYPDIEVYMLSNLSDEIYIKKSKQQGASQFIDKSFDFESISSLLLKKYEDKKSEQKY